MVGPNSIVILCVCVHGGTDVHYFVSIVLFYAMMILRCVEFVLCVPPCLDFFIHIAITYGICDIMQLSLNIFIILIYVILKLLPIKIAFVYWCLRKVSDV